MEEDKSYLENNLPPHLVEAIRYYHESYDTPHFDLGYCDVQASINIAEVDGEITHEQAVYLRRKYLNYD